MRDIIKVHEDVLTVHIAMRELMDEYTSNGYEVVRLSMMNFKLVFPDGWVHFYWEKGRIYQEIIEMTA